LLSCADRASEREAPRPPHVVLVVIDTLRADALGFGGSPHGSPHLDRLADESVVFTQAIAPSTWTLPSVASLLTSLHPSEIGLFGGAREDEQLTRTLADEHLTLAEVFRDHGYRTVGVVNQVFLTAKRGFGQGYDRYEILPTGADGHRLNRRLERSLATFEVAPRSGNPTGAREASRVAPLFIHVHYFDPHWPYRYRSAEDREDLPTSLEAADRDLDPPRGGDQATHWMVDHGEGEQRRQALETLAARYALEVRWVDGVIAGLIDLLQGQGIWDDAVLVVTADHGEGFWEHQRLLHGHSPHEEQIHVPLLVRPPPALAFESGARSSPVSLVDLMPTLLDLAALPIPAHCRGRSLVPAMRGEEDGTAAVLVETGGERALRTRNGKLIVRGAGGRIGRDSDTEAGVSIEYYDLVADPGERRNLASPCVGPCGDSLRRLLEIERRLERPAHQATSVEVSPEELEQLRSLGYVGD
jgi:arylsulfatase A-like enzyme